nr:hypothetical protein [Oligoflexales bacterium]
MLSIRKRKTKLIWSISSSHCNLQQLEDIASEEWDGIRFVYDEASYANMLPSVAQVRKKIHKAHPFAMMLDLAGHTRARISDTFKSRELKYGETVTLTNARESSEKIAVSSKHPWNELFRQDCEVYLGYGDIILKIMQLSKEEAVCEVKQGGLLSAKMDLHIPATRDYLKGEDILKAHYKEFIEAGCNYIILP